MKLRDYQADSLRQILGYWRDNPTGHLVVDLPGGSGKSVVIGAFVKGIMQSRPHAKILMMVAVKELIEQNAEKLVQLWPNAPMGIYSAAVGKKQGGHPITYGGIGSLRNRAAMLGHIDLIVIDEAHMINNAQQGSYRRLIGELMEINPKLKIVGFTATPYRLGQGMLTEGDEALFTDIINPVTIQDLVDRGFLSPLRSKEPRQVLSTEGLKRRGGEFVAGQMQAEFNTDDNNSRVCTELCIRAAERKHWLIFCAGIEHAQQVAETLKRMGIAADYVDGKHGKGEREAKIAAFERGEIRALCNVGILTTGYDFPALDCVVFLRATDSPALYLQMAVRGMRLADGKQDCLVLDFVGNVKRHGPVTDITPPSERKKGGGEPMVKACPCCGEIIHMSIMICPECQHIFEAKEENKFLRTDDIMGGPSEMLLTCWRAHYMTSRSGNKMIRLDYHGADYLDPLISEFFLCFDKQYAADNLWKILIKAGGTSNYAEFSAMLKQPEQLPRYIEGLLCPAAITYVKDGKYYKVKKRMWEIEQ